MQGPAADVAAGVVVTVLMLLVASESTDVGPRPFGPLAAAAICLAGLWSGFARRWPRMALLGSLVSTLVAFSFFTPAFTPTLSMTIPLFAVGAAGRLWWGAAALAALGLSGAPFRLLEDDGVDTVVVMVETIKDLALLAVVMLLGETVRSRRVLREEAALRLQIAAAEHRRRVTDERLRTARDLHDVLAHTITVVTIQAGVAAESLEGRPDRAMDALDRVRAASRDAIADLRGTIADLRGTIAVLREESPAHTQARPMPGLDQVSDLVDAARSAGLDVCFEESGEPIPLRPAIELAVYRVVQESLTNVLRHANASTARVHLQHGPDGVRVEVRDNGSGLAPATDGFGVRGMAERVGALGGVVWSGPLDGDGRGYVVRAQLPRK